MFSRYQNSNSFIATHQKNIQITWVQVLLSRPTGWLLWRTPIDSLCNLKASSSWPMGFASLLLSIVRMCDK